MGFMNEYDIDQAVHRHTRDSYPNRLAAALVLDHLREWADAHSDGWAYWPKPARAAARLIEIAHVWHADSDVSDAELAAAAKPVKAFLTRQAREIDSRTGRPRVTAEEREIILRSVTE